MSLQADREKAHEQLLLAKDKLADPQAVVVFLVAWFRSLKQWEAEETFERAFFENRMCARMAPGGGSALGVKQTKPTHGIDGPIGEVTLRYHLGATPLHQDPANFGAGPAKPAEFPVNFAAGASRKTELGLHDVSAVLLDSKLPISKQLFSKLDRQPLFIPIPHEEDLALLYQIEQIAKVDRAGAIYDFYVWARARITRIKYGADEDMKTGFAEFARGETRHFRYGDAREGGKLMPAEILRQRRENALKYKSLVLTGKIADNNEVTLKIRHHAGSFPWVGLAGPAEFPPPASIKIKKDEYLLATISPNAVVGYVTDNGKFRVK